jgi:hypothetical protein
VQIKAALSGGVIDVMIFIFTYAILIFLVVLIFGISEFGLGFIVPYLIGVFLFALVGNLILQRLFPLFSSV